jgi:isocitrate/isopropylmalate dehydrogenase
MILSVAMMLDWLGHAETTAAAERLRAAVERVLANPIHRTADLGGKLSTDEMGNLIASELERTWHA